MDLCGFSTVLNNVATHTTDSPIEAAFLVDVPVFAATVARAVVGIAAVTGLKVEAGIKQGLSPTAFIV